MSGAEELLIEGNLLPFNLTEDEGQSLLFDLLVPPAHAAEEDGHLPGSTLIQHLEHLGARMAILELGYIDQDYRDEFAAFYAGCFADISSLCDRLLFFSDEPLTEIGPETIGQLKGFLGYSVLRPLTHARIGRSMLKGQPTRLQSLACLGESRVHLLGHEFSVVGTPFMQQTTEISSCAQISLWTVSYLSSLRSRRNSYTTARVNELATREYRLKRTVPTEGLEPEAMAEALNAMGFGPLVYSPSVLESAEEKDLSVLDAHRNVAVRSLASGCPPIFVLQDDGKPSHAIVAIGIKWNTDCQAASLANIGSLVESFVVTDDLKGPYVQRTFSDHDISEEMLERVILPFPKKVYLKLEDAEDSARCLLTPEKLSAGGLLNKDTSKEFAELLSEGRILLNTYTIGSVGYKSRLRERVGTKRAFAKNHLISRMPKWLVVTELVVVDEEGRPSGVCGELIMDSTSHISTPPLLVAHIPGALVVHDSSPTDGELEAITNRRWHVNDVQLVELDDDDALYLSCSELRLSDACQKE